MSFFADIPTWTWLLCYGMFLVVIWQAFGEREHWKREYQRVCRERDTMLFHNQAPAQRGEGEK